ncbi:MAG: metallophosphoesterase [Phycisphaerae bacterium]|nr:metallophosphoesterase [Phycisphaerae bacterium]
MLVGVLSDTHDHLSAIRVALRRFAAAGITTLLHPGDLVAPFAARLLAEFSGEVHVTYGNNDGERKGLRDVLPRIQDGPLWLTLGGKRILLHHFIDWCRPADIAAADIVVTGHTHEVAVERRGGKLLLNPGECCGWLTGRCTIATLDLDTCDANIIELPI